MRDIRSEDPGIEWREIGRSLVGLLMAGALSIVTLALLSVSVGLVARLVQASFGFGYRVLGMEP